MPAPEGNDYNLKYKTSKERKKVCHEWCEHLKKGLSKKCFPNCDLKTIKFYMKKYPEDFPPDIICEAERLGMLFWEKMGVEGTSGKTQHFKPLSWKFNMTNRFPEDWRDKKVVEQQGINDTGSMTKEEKEELDAIRDMAIDDYEDEEEN